MKAILLAFVFICFRQTRAAVALTSPDLQACASRGAPVIRPGGGDPRLAV
jgi:hypothetical protein